MITSNNFKEYEFNKCSPSCSLQDMDQSFINRLDFARDIAGVPFVLLSAYRPVKHEVKKGRSGKGDHPQRKGVDIKAEDSRTRFKILMSLMQVGFNRIGISDKFIHVGEGSDLDENVVWLYK